MNQDKLKPAILQLWHISRTAMAGSGKVATRHDRMMYVKNGLVKWHEQLIADMTPKQIWLSIEEHTTVFS